MRSSQCPWARYCYLPHSADEITWSNSTPWATGKSEFRWKHRPRSNLKPWDQMGPRLHRFEKADITQRYIHMYMCISLYIYIHMTYVYYITQHQGLGLYLIIKHTNELQWKIFTWVYTEMFANYFLLIWPCCMYIGIHILIFPVIVFLSDNNMSA